MLKLQQFWLVRWPVVMGLVLILVLSGCASRGSPVVADHSPVFGAMPANYQVRVGDTLYSIAWRYGLDVIDLANINKIVQPFTIYPRQQLMLRRPRQLKTTPSIIPKTRKSKAGHPSNPSKSPESVVKATASNWLWPVKISPLLGYGEQGGGGISNGMYYELPNRTTVRAAATGTVVYAGPGLGGYERLIILDHGQALLSAYGFHGQPRVREQQVIKVGAELADTLGSSSDFSRFHFEVRKHGQPLDPRRLILR